MKKEMKDKVLLHINDLDRGGAEKSLLNFINQYENDYDITLLLARRRGDLLSEVPKGVKIIELYRNDFEFSLYKIISLVIPRFVQKRVQKKVNSDNYKYVISYLELFPTIALESYPAHKKIAFVHNNLNLIQDNTKINISRAWKRYDKYDEIICVSNNAKIALIDLIGTSHNITVINNIQNNKDIIEKSQESFELYDNTKINFVTVARFEKQKSLDRIIYIANHIRNKNVCFHLVGQGSEYKKIQTMIQKYNLEDVIKLHGLQKNPYPFIKHADAVLMVSKFEGFPMVFQEAKILQIPIITTDVSDSRNTIDKVYGYVSENSEQGISNLVNQVVENTDMIDAILKKYSSSIENENIRIISKLNEVIFDKS